MKGVVFTTDEKMYVKDFPEPLADSLKATIGGDPEKVSAKHLRFPLCLIADKDRASKGLDVNLFGSSLYDDLSEAPRITGDVVVLAEGFNKKNEFTFVGLSETQIVRIMERAVTTSSGSIEEVAAQ